MWRHIGLLCVLFCCLVLSASAADESRKYENGITIVHSSTMSPFCFEGYNGEAKGVLADFWRQWSKVTGVPVKFILSDWPTAFELFRSGKADVFGGIYPTQKREKTMLFSEPLYPVRSAFFVVAGSGIESDEDIATSRIGALKKGAALEYVMTTYPDAQVRKYTCLTDLVQGLMNGEIDIAASDYITFMYASGTLGVVKEFEVLKYLYSKVLHAAILKGNDELLALVNSGLKKIDADERERILRRWYVKDKESDYSLVLSLSGVGIALAIVLIYFMVAGSRRKNRNN